MLNTDPTHLAQLVGEAERERDERLERLRLREQTAMGALRDSPEDTESPENLALAVYLNVLPSMITSSPASNVTSEGTYEEVVQAAAIGAALRQTAKKQKMHMALEPCAWDFFFKPHAAAFIEKPMAKMRDLTKAERKTAKGRLWKDDEMDVGGDSDDVKSPRATPRPNQPSKAQWPGIVSLDVTQCGFDCRGRTLAEARFTWNQVREDKDDLQRRADEHSDDWYPDGVATMAAWRTDDMHTGQMKVDRDEVCYYIVYVPGGVLEGTEPKPYQPGTVHTIAVEGGGSADTPQGMEIRRPFYWEGHPSGPHIFGGQYTTGHSSFFLSLLGAHEDSLAMLESVSASLHDRIRNHKTVHAYDATVEGSVREIMKARDGDFVSVPGLRDGNGTIQPISTSEVSPAEVAEYQQMKLNAGEQVGLDASGRGQADGSATATAVSVAANATRSKVDYLIKKWLDFVRECEERRAWELAFDDRVAVRLDTEGREKVLRQQLLPLVQDGSITMPMLEELVDVQKREPMMFQGGDFAGEDDRLDWFSLDLTIEPNSMEGGFGEQAIARESVFNEQLSFIGTMAVQQPHIRWKDRLRATSRALGMPSGEELLDTEIAAQVAQIQLASASNEAGLASEESPSTREAGATLRVASGGAESPAGVDPGSYGGAA